MVQAHLFLFCFSPGIGCFSREAGFLLVGNGIRDQDLGLSVFTAIGVSLFSADSAKKCLRIYAHTHTYAYLHILTHILLHNVYLRVHVHTYTRNHEFLLTPPISVPLYRVILTIPPAAFLYVRSSTVRIPGTKSNISIFTHLLSPTMHLKEFHCPYPHNQHVY